MGQHVNVLFGQFQIHRSMRPVSVRASLAPLDQIALLHEEAKGRNQGRHIHIEGWQRALQHTHCLMPLGEPQAAEDGPRALRAVLWDAPEIGHPFEIHIIYGDAWHHLGREEQEHSLAQLLRLVFSLPLSFSLCLSLSLCLDREGE